MGGAVLGGDVLPADPHLAARVDNTVWMVRLRRSGDQQADLVPGKGSHGRGLRGRLAAVVRSGRGGRAGARGARTGRSRESHGRSGHDVPGELIERPHRSTAFSCGVLLRGPIRSRSMSNYLQSPNCFRGFALPCYSCFEVTGKRTRPAPTALTPPTRFGAIREHECGHTTWPEGDASGIRR